ncbi:MAG TPA: endonuclease/exonuclease/phosphatase family protein [Candidatus Babeliales bacterium]|nr:endonuclease/exonuclease/phosphatase family protein [Candidatus Babeliales bacterium]
MKNNISISISILMLLPMGAITTTIKGELTMASYNITHGKKNNWPKRQPGVCNLIQKINADIYCLQEIIKDNQQLDSIQTALSNYKYVGKPRSSGIKGLSLWHRFVMNFAQDEYCPIFYNPTKINILAHDTFGINGDQWTSALLPRICTWAHCKEITTGKEFYVYNTHLDHKDQEKRLMQIKLILNDTKKRCGNTPTIITGDFNTTVTFEVEKIFSDADFIHARTVAHTVEGSTVTHIKGGKGFECDHIMIKPKDAFAIQCYKIFDKTISDTTSDHNPISMIFSLN